ncbi:hypothetical protein P886_3416 [Alteromonadaceae bacterium 2753L.S.0a.02]|nr:hypothetical protein P886_3416 [Alteromonadaceae bacterium 2753L.S.0a.02]
MYQNFLLMPTVLKFMTVHAMACSFFLLVAVIPGVPFTVNGEVLSYKEAWESGYSVNLLVIGVVMPILAVQLLARRKYCRQLYTAASACVLILPYLYWQQYALAMLGLACTLVITLYLFKNGRVLAYFGS